MTDTTEATQSTGTDPIVLSMTASECSDHCLSGTFQWELDDRLQERLHQLAPEDRQEAEMILRAFAHNWLSATARLAQLLEYGMPAFRNGGVQLLEIADDALALTRTLEELGPLVGIAHIIQV